MFRAFGLISGFAVLAAALGCAAPPSAEAPTEPKGVYAAALARRLAQVDVGDSAESVRARLARHPVRRPRPGGEPFPSPLRSLALTTPEGRAVELELYVVAVEPGPGCPAVHTELAPVVYLDGRVAGLDWDYVEASWRDWGGSLAALREARGVHECPFAPPAPPSPGPPLAPAPAPSPPPPPGS